MKQDIKDVDEKSRKGCASKSDSALLFARGLSRKARVKHRRAYDRLRLSVLRENPLCTECSKRGYTVAAEQVDHIVPISTGKTMQEVSTLLMDRENMQPLCINCHIWKTKKENEKRQRKKPPVKWRNKGLALYDEG